MQCREFFSHVLSLNYMKKKHQKMFIKILSNIGTIDEVNGLIVTKDSMILYFSTPGLFLDLERLSYIEKEDRVQRAKTYIGKKMKRVSNLNGAGELADEKEKVPNEKQNLSINEQRLSSQISEHLQEEFHAELTKSMELKKGEISKPFIERSVSVVEEVEPKKTNKTCSDKMISFLDNPFYQAFLVLFNLIAILGTTLLDRQIDLDTTYELIML